MTIRILAGAVLSAGGLACLVWMWWMRLSGNRTEGVVVDSGGQWSSFLPNMSFGCRSWRPVVQFTAAGGRMVVFRSKFGTPVRYEPGEPVPVCYRATRPGVAMIDTFSQAWLIPAALVLTGIVVLASVTA